MFRSEALAHWAGEPPPSLGATGHGPHHSVANVEGTERHDLRCRRHLSGWGPVICCQQYRPLGLPIQKHKPPRVSVTPQNLTT
jgi:hypothetical protein